MKLFSKKDTCVMDNVEVRNLKWKSMQYDEMYEELMGVADNYSDPKFDNWLKFYYPLYTPGVAVIKSLRTFIGELNSTNDELKEQNGHLERDNNNIFEATIRLNKENESLSEENEGLSEEITNMNEKLWKCDKEIERLKKEVEYQELLNSKLTDANVKQFETIMHRNAEVDALKHMLDRLEENK